MLHLYFMDHRPIILGDVPQFRFIWCLLTIRFKLCVFGRKWCYAQIRYTGLLCCWDTKLYPQDTPAFSRLLHSSILFSVISVLRGDASRLWNLFRGQCIVTFIWRTEIKLQESPLPFHHVSFINNNAGFGGWTQLIRHGSKYVPPYCTIFLTSSKCYIHLSIHRCCYGLFISLFSRDRIFCYNSSGLIL